MATDRPRPSVLTSDVHNEAELIFGLIAVKELVSSLDCVTLARGMGMNPVQADMKRLQDEMQPLIEELTELRLEEERRKQKEAAKLEKKDPKKDTKKDPKKDEKKDEKKEGEAKEGEDGQPKRKVLPAPEEEMKNIDWHIFISCIEPMYKDNRQEVSEVVQALGLFDEDGTKYLSVDKIIEIVTQGGESVLSPAEVKQLRDAFPEKGYKIQEFAERLQGTYVPPPPPSAEELAAEEEARRKAEEEAKKKAEADNLLGDL